ncbi:CDP-alcohol phosphatidyltransferase family protein [Breoghania sp. L-A4]|uniref:CDP-alcohol phosphatidyltransferase family protein n=1 Tax=Breoghania sp. L-A4 TaxID=2304600 RepID=UPI000E35B89C|nr:CDP-alcohol phosphatidyltransferase family protein [Breoghania sp. L-A4]AXS40588.1 phosphatidylcholine synthase [Breoghania sp. L-A4]
MKTSDATAVVRAFSVHLLTASGALWALLALLAAAEGNWPMTFAWLGVALLVDGVDGPLARAVKITERLPNWSGSSLDFVIDYATYVLVPAFALANCGLLDSPYNLIAAGLVVITGALYFAYEGMKTPDNSFRGFPVTWNMLVFDLMVFQALHAWTFVIVLVFAVLTFAPVNFVHPVRVKRWRPLNLAITALWLGSAFAAARNGMVAEGAVGIGLAASSLYLLGVGALLQLAKRSAAKTAG